MLVLGLLVAMIFGTPIFIDDEMFKEPVINKHLFKNSKVCIVIGPVQAVSHLGENSSRRTCTVTIWALCCS